MRAGHRASLDVPRTAHSSQSKCKHGDDSILSTGMSGRELQLQNIWAKERFSAVRTEMALNTASSVIDSSTTGINALDDHEKPPWPVLSHIQHLEGSTALPQSPVPCTRSVLRIQHDATNSKAGIPFNVCAQATKSRLSLHLGLCLRFETQAICIVFWQGSAHERVGIIVSKMETAALVQKTSTIHRKVHARIWYMWPKA